MSPREGDAQKALRRSYITGALVCGRNPKLVAAELGHATSHMVVSNYDSFLDPRTWPEAEEIERLRAIYGWGTVEGRSTVAPPGHPEVSAMRTPMTRARKRAELRGELARREGLLVRLRRPASLPGAGRSERSSRFAKKSWHAGRDSNPRPPGSKPGALSS